MMTAAMTTMTLPTIFSLEVLLEGVTVPHVLCRELLRPGEAVRVVLLDALVTQVDAPVRTERASVSLCRLHDATNKLIH